VNREIKTVQVTIDNKTFHVPTGSTILEVAQQNEIYIPTLCYHHDLSPHGGCRLCIVEVEGLRTFPTACTTPVDEGMIIRTKTAQIQAMRMDILQLFLSEHTSSCLVCDEKKSCRESMETIRKAGVTTGCRYCPKDGQCELQAVAEYLDVRDIAYPISYRGLRVETEDPFYDRDYNLCILCGRCVRMCQEIRIANVLAYKFRGRNTIVGPAFHRTHLEAGCEFCGACVAVCPTGSLREKARAWEGIPEREEQTTCFFCGVGCQVKLLIKDDRVIGSLPADDALVNRGQLCVKGRFCSTELVNGYQRVRNPYTWFGTNKAEISWDHASTVIAEKIRSCEPNEFAMLVSPNCTTEDLYIAQKFARVAVGTNNIDSSARQFYGSGINAYLNLLRMSVPLSSIDEASVIVTVGLDTRYARSVVGVAMRRAMKHGARIVSINPRHHNFSLIASQWMQPQAGEEAAILNEIRHCVEKKKSSPDNQIAGIVKLLQESKNTIVLIGSEFLQYDNATDILTAVERLAHATGAGVMPLPAQNNFVGSLLSGAYTELLPGAFSFEDKEQISAIERVWNATVPSSHTGWNAMARNAEIPLKVLYLMGELPSAGISAFTIFQNLYPPDSGYNADIVLPAAASTEIDGSFVNGEGRVQQVKRGVPPVGNALPDWVILCRLAQTMGIKGFDFTSVEDIRKEMGQLIHTYSSAESINREPHQLHEYTVFNVPMTKSAVRQKSDGHSFQLTISAIEHTHRGFPLAALVEGSKMLLTEGYLEINPDDARSLGIDAGETVVVSGSPDEHEWPVKISRDQPRGSLHISLRDVSCIQSNPQPVHLRKTHV
jgi:predicted molibdopterin-dependent oxidoreductase YjgC